MLSYTEPASSAFSFSFVGSIHCLWSECQSIRFQEPWLWRLRTSLWLQVLYMLKPPTFILAMWIPSDSRLQISTAVCIIDMNFCFILPPPLRAPAPYNPGALASSCIWNSAACPTIAAVNAPLPASTTCGWATARPSSWVSLRVLHLELVLAPKSQQWKQSTPSLL